MGDSMDVYMVSGEDRTKALPELFQQFDFEEFRGKSVAIKANFNSADVFPASTHADTLQQLLEVLQNAGSSITLVERSGMSSTDEILSELDVFDLVSAYNGTVITLDGLDTDHFSRFYGEHWHRGFLLAQPFLDADVVISTCCLKTHRFGGHFTLSLKNSVGAIARTDPQDKYDYMRELHGSPYQRTMIAEINAALPCNLVILDAVKGFSTLGPEQGNLISPGVILASEDRVSIDAVGVAILRHYGTTPEVEKGTVFEQEQIKRAGELRIGAQSPDEVKVIPLDEKSSNLAENLAIS